jgi:hypothetical protein
MIESQVQKILAIGDVLHINPFKGFTPIPWDSKDKEIFAMLDDIRIVNNQ